ncbi:PLP-dependent cysteine synthase family protein [Clostridium sp.]|uniref:PLP-dependent cysteine synthase family protein n=1 Tax=Clostridium sp. TaxID=1506 RepID=UPI0034642786
MGYINSIFEIIGHTPILKLNNLDIKEGVNIFVKLEGQNPGGSIKDRIGIYMIKNAEDRGELKKGDTIIEATAGNTGIGVALGAINRGYNVIFVVPEKFSKEKQVLMKALGATIISTPKEEGIEGAVKRAKELLKEIPRSISLDQFNNYSNPKCHYETTAPEIYEDLKGEIDYFVAGAGSGGTFTGVLKYLKEKNSNISGILADPEGSILGGGEEGDYNIEGIGNNFIPGTMNMDYVDKVVKVSDEEALEMVKNIALKEGLIVGTSSAANIVASLKLSRDIEKGNIVTILPDRGDRYFTKNIYTFKE